MLLDRADRPRLAHLGAKRPSEATEPLEEALRMRAEIDDEAVETGAKAIAAVDAWLAAPADDVVSARRS
jgi:hypothetical protein